CFLHRIAHELMDGAALAKADLYLGGMHVDVDLTRVDIEPQRVRRLPVVMKHVAIGLAQRMREHAIAHESPVDEYVLRVARAAGIGGICRANGPAGERECRSLRLNRRRLCGERLAQQSIDARAATAADETVAHGGVVAECERGLGMRERDTSKRLLAMSIFG